MTSETVNRLTGAAVRISLAAGKAILNIYRRHGKITAEQKHDNSPLTAADRAAHELIVAELSALDPCLPILSEEGSFVPYQERKSWEYFWLVDPLDGTKEFIKKNGEFTVNIALIGGDRRPINGVVYAPALDVLYFAAKNTGAFRIHHAVGRADLPLKTDALLHVLIAESSPLPQARTSRRYTIVGSRSHTTDAFDTFVREQREKRGTIGFTAAGSSLKFCLVAEGSADVYPRFGPTMEWDTAAGQAVVESAGGAVVSAGSGAPLTCNKPELRNDSFIAYAPPETSPVMRDYMTAEEQ